MNINDGTSTRRTAQLLAIETGLPRDTCEKVLNKLLAVIVSELRAGRRVRVGRLGDFARKMMAAKKLKHPKTGKIINVPARKIIGFEKGKRARGDIFK